MHKVIVIDTDAGVRRFVVACLTRSGIPVQDTDCPVQASRICIRFPATLVITDVILRISGDEALHLLHTALPRASVLLTTGIPHHETLQRWRVKPGVYVLLKPFRPHQLLATLNGIPSEFAGPVSV